LTLSGLRIRDTTADGINFHGGVTNSTITNNDIRNTGDDGIATWADAGIGADANDTISNNTVQLQMLATGIAIYGGHDNTVSGNLVVDTGLNQGGGITAAQRFSSTALGKTTISNNTLIRDGDLDPNWQFGVGALWFDGSQGAIAGPVNVSNALIEQSPFEAVQWVEGTVSGVSLNNVSIIGTGTFAMQEQTGGTATFSNVTATGVNGPAAVYSCEGSQFAVTDGGGNSGISGAAYCGPWPAPVYPPYPSTGVTVSPGALNFGSVATGASSAAQTVTVSNPTGTAAAVSAITASGDYSQTNNCGSTIAANGSCAISVTFRPAAAGTRTGAITVTAGGTTSTVSLSGTGVAPGPVLAASPGSLSFASTTVGGASGAQPVTISNTGTAAATVSGVSVSGDFAQTNNCSAVAAGGSCTVNVTFKPTASGARTGTLTLTSNANNSPTAIALSGNGIGTDTNIAAGQPASASSSSSPYLPVNLTDADTSSYWESANGSWPQWAQVDLGSATSIGKVVLKLPPAAAWQARTETLSVQGSTDGANFATIVASTGYTFDPATGNTVTIPFGAATARYLRVTLTANTGWNAGQLSDLEVFPSGGGSGSASLTASPTAVSFCSTTVGSTSAAQSVTVHNGGTVAASVSAVTASGDFAQTNTCGASIAAGASCTVSVTFRPTAAGSRSGSVSVTSNAANSPSTVALSGTGAVSGNTNLALHAATAESSHTQTYASSSVTDGDPNSYWESANNSFPQWVQADLGSAQAVGRVVLKLPPSSSWASRSQTLSIQGSTDGASFSTLKASASYTFDPSTGNVVTITFTAASTRYLRVTITANTGQPGGQLSELEAYAS
ncbi:MAG: choice-of-anchor D domain-containing protein, partial [Jatrophihabitantaceae bacterium]